MSHPELKKMLQQLESWIGEEGLKRNKQKNAAIEALHEKLERKRQLERYISVALWWLGLIAIMGIIVFGFIVWYWALLAALAWVVSVNLIMPAISNRLWQVRHTRGIREIIAEFMPRHETDTVSKLARAAESVDSHEQSESPSLADMLMKDLGSDFPVSSGDGKKHDPLVLRSGVNAPAVEGRVIRHCQGMLREDFEIFTQNLLMIGGRYIDEVLVNVKKAGDADWSGGRRYYFDITSTM